MRTRFKAAKCSCINILQAEANKEDGVQQAKQINLYRKLKYQKVQYKVLESNAEKCLHLTLIVLLKKSILPQYLVLFSRP